MKVVLTRPSLQDPENGAFCPVPFATGDFVGNSPDGACDTHASKCGSLLATFSGSLAGWPDSLHQLPIFAVATASSWHAGKPCCHSSAGSLPGDCDETNADNACIGSYGSWSPLQGKTINLSNQKSDGTITATTRENEEGKRNLLGKNRKVYPDGLLSTVDCGLLSHC